MFPRQFQYLIALEQEGHFGRAATRCNVSQPTLSSAIKHLEEQIGVPIIQITDKTFANADCTPRPRLESNAMIALAVHAVQG